MVNMTTIQLRKTTLERLKEQKPLAKVSYDDVINRLLDEADDETLSNEEIADIQESLEQIKKGEVHSLEDVAKELNVKL